jgi:hypothetical protein
MQDRLDDWNREPAVEIDSDLVLQQLNRMLRSRHFRTSKRYPAFLDYIVRRRLEGDFDSLKERILGIEVFKRPHDYDTSADPVVRISAGEVRKRIALYYHDEGREQDLRIELPAGSYVPVFSFAAGAPPPLKDTLPSLDPSLALPGVDEAARPIETRPSARFLIGVLAILIAASLCAGTWVWVSRSSPTNAMWHSFFSSPDPVLIVVGSPLGRLVNGTPAEPLDPRHLDSHSHVHVALTDAIAVADAAALLQSHGQSYRVQAAAEVSLDDLRKRPVILVSAFGNPWSARMLAPLRFSLLREQVAPDNTTVIGTILDQLHPDARWSFDFTKSISVNSKGYAIVARLQSDLTEGSVVVIAGLGSSATESAGEFVCSPEYLKQISAVAPSNWRDKNMEAVLEVPIVDGKGGHARVVAYQFW